MKKQLIITIIIIVTTLFALSILFLWYFNSAKMTVKQNMDEFLASEQNSIAVEDLSEFQHNSLLAVEDPNFYHHNGMDFFTPGAGITTITQSLVKRLYFDNFKQGIAKFEQTIVAVLIVDPMYSKEDQLTVFINEFPFNPEAIGMSGAARYYYDKKFSQLTDDEYLGIVAMFIQPARFDIKDNPEANQDRVEKIKEVLSGEYVPASNSDVFYDQNNQE